MKTYHIVRARHALGILLSGHNVPEKLGQEMLAMHDALLAIERQDIAGQKAAIIRLCHEQEPPGATS